MQVVTRGARRAPDEVFAEWEAEPFAAASIGQVHRATTRGGERVAVKVQYPGIDKAIENDLKSVSLLETMIAPIGRAYHTKETLDEIKAVFLAELDYGREAEIADVFRRIHAGRSDDRHPARLHHALDHERVLTLELIGGVDYATFCEKASQEERERRGRDDLALHVPRALPARRALRRSAPRQLPLPRRRARRVPRLRLRQGDAAGSRRAA